MAERLDAAREILRQTFGFDDFRSGQREIMEAVLHGRNVLGVMPTGGGKSLCFQIPALVFPATTLVVSPLVALMTDQVDRLRERGVAAAALHSGLPQGEINNIMHEAHAGRIKLLYVAPERLESTTFRSQLSTVSLSLLAVDEAHCISEWGHDFRPAYRAISKLFEERPRVPIVALTATATPDVRADIIQTLKLQKPVEIVRGFDRENLTFRVASTPYKAEAVARTALAEPDASIIVYAGSRRRVDTIADELRKRGIAAAPYHAGKTPGERSDVQDRFLRDDIRVLVATNAFGMGVDKPDVRHVFHADLTQTLEAYYQEAGRAGRDGKPATCTLLHQTEDRRLMDFFITATYPERSTILAVTNHLYDRARIGVGGSSTDPVQADTDSIAADLHLPAGHVSGVLSLLEREGVILSTGAQGNATLRMRTTTDRLREFVANAPAERRTALNELGRLLASSSFDRPVRFDITGFLRRTAVTSAEFADAVRSLHTARILTYTPPEGGGGIVLMRPRPPRGVVHVDLDDLARRRAHAQQKLQQMIDYAETPQCKRNTILNYFGDPDFTGTCGRCSSCTGDHVVTREVLDTELVASIVRTVHEVEGRFGRNVIADVVTGTVSARVLDYGLSSSTQWGAAAGRSRAEVVRTIDAALDQGYLVKSTGEYPTIAATQRGIDASRPLPPIRRFRRTTTRSGVDRETFAALMAWRQRTAHAQDAPPPTILSNDALEALATDQPDAESALEVGRHGSGLALAQYGSEVVRVIAGVRQQRVESVPKVRSDAETERVVRAVRPGRTVEDVARTIRVTPAAAARSLQRAMEAGLALERHDLVPDDVFADVLQYLREHRYAKLRHVREHLESDVDMPTLRVAVAFARRELYGAP